MRLLARRDAKRAGRVANLHAEEPCEVGGVQEGDGAPSVVAPNHLQRQFYVLEPNKVWVTDISVPQHAA